MHIYNDYGTMLKEKYGEKIYKLPVNLPVSCPNRDGTRGCGGCRFAAKSARASKALTLQRPSKNNCK